MVNAMATKAAKSGISFLLAILLFLVAASFSAQGCPAGLADDGGAAPQRREAGLALPVATKLILALPGPAESIGVNDAAPPSLSTATSTAGIPATRATPSPAVAAPTCSSDNSTDAAPSSTSSSTTTSSLAVPLLHPTEVAAAGSSSSSSSAVVPATTDALTDTPNTASDHQPAAVRTCSCECVAAAGAGRHPTVVKLCRVLKWLKAFGML